MTPSPSTASRAARAAPGRLFRHLATARVDGRPGGAAGRRDLVIVATAVVAMAVVLSGPLVWLVAILLLAAVVVGTFRILADDDASGSGSGVPIESLFLPAIAAIGCLGAMRLVPAGLGVVPALVAAGILIDRALAIESAMARAVQGPTADDRIRTLMAILVVALVAFVGVAAIVPGGIAGTGPPGAPTVALPIGDLAVLALADAGIAGFLGYRAAALRSTSVREALWAAATYAAAIAVGAAAIRAMGIPRLIGPALLMFLFYLWDTLHAVTPSRRRDPRWIWETVALAGVGAAVAFWNLRLVG
ncbi:MAG: hypothetical protein H0U52_07655 [Chloroflexi bacterium]|nr:hypothetical protein [Chloroflexota bacterium]